MSNTELFHKTVQEQCAGLNEVIARQRERAAIYHEFHGNSHSMTFEIQRLRALVVRDE